MSKVVESLIFRVSGVTNYKKSVKQACADIAEEAGIPDVSNYYGDMSAKEIREIVEDFGEKVYKYQDLSTTDVEFIPEPENEYDTNAIKILIIDNFVGYVPSKIAKQIHKYFSNDKYLISAAVDIVGGPYKEWDDYEEKVITDNSLDVGFEVYLSIIDSSQEEQEQLESNEMTNDITDSETIEIAEIAEITELAIDKHDEESINTTEVTESVTEKNHEENINTTEITESLTEKNHEETIKNTVATEQIIDEHNGLADQILLTNTLPKKKFSFVKIVFAALYIFLILFGIVGIPIAPFIAIPFTVWIVYKLFKLFKK